MLTRLSLLATLLASSAASADTHRIAVLDFDGPQTLADSGHDAVVRALGRDHSLVPPKAWLDAKSSTSHTKYFGTKWWETAARRAGVDAVIEGWMQDDGRNKVLTVVVTDAVAGKELEELTIPLPGGRWDEGTQRALRKGLDERLGELTPPPAEDPNPRSYISGTKPPPAQPATPAQPAVLTEQPIGPQPPPKEEATTPPAPATVATAEQKPLASLELKEAPWIDPGTKHVPQKTERFRVDLGGGVRSRSFVPNAEGDGTTPYSGVPDKFIAVGAAFYPFPWKKTDGKLSGPGFQFSVDQSVGNTVTFSGEEDVSDFNIDQHGWNAGIHYRAPLGDYFSVDGEVGYGSRTYNIDDATEEFEVPNAAYHYLEAGSHFDLAITDRASVGFGGKYFHVLDAGDVTSTEWYGPGKTSGLSVDANFVVPLPAKLYVRGDLSYTRFKTSFDGVGVITEDEDVLEATDSTVSGSVKIGISF